MNHNKLIRILAIAPTARGFGYAVMEGSSRLIAFSNKSILRNKNERTLVWVEKFNFEKSTLTEITQARASVGQVKIDPTTAPTDPAKLAAFDQAQGQLSSALSRLLVVVERYPNLTATENFRDLQAQLEGTENRISVERRDFNGAVQSYDTAIKSFPAVFYAAALGFQYKPYFAAAPGAETTPKVQFDFGNGATKKP